MELLENHDGHHGQDGAEVGLCRSNAAALGLHYHATLGELADASVKYKGLGDNMLAAEETLAWY
jgi:hypothetical protein